MMSRLLVCVALAAPLAQAWTSPPRFASRAVAGRRGATSAVRMMAASQLEQLASMVS